jgi:hypothetical protein
VRSSRDRAYWPCAIVLTRRVHYEIYMVADASGGTPEEHALGALLI